MPDRLKVMLVESDPQQSKHLTAGLTALGLDLTCTGDAVSALAIARQAPPDALLIGPQFPGGSALTLLRRLRANINTTNIPVLALTGALPAALSGELMHTGAQACLPRQATPDEIYHAIDAHQLLDLDFTAAMSEVLNEPERIAALQATGLLDSPPEELFDELARLVSTLLGAPAALMTLVDGDRQFFKSQVGLGEPLASERQNGLPYSFCQWVVGGREPLFIDDARVHPVLGRNPAVKELGVVAYAGALVEAPGGQPLGSLCAVDVQPHAWSSEELDTLHDLAAVARAYIVLREAATTSSAAAQLAADHIAALAVQQMSGQSNGSSGSSNGLALDSQSLAARGEALRALTRVLKRHAPEVKEEARGLLLKAIARQAGEVKRVAEVV